jgi:hypothetical protein
MALANLIALITLITLRILIALISLINIPVVTDDHGEAQAKKLSWK